MNLGDPSDVGLAQVPARLLAALAQVSGGVTIRQLARISGVSLARTHYWVTFWADRGVVTQLHAGRALMCSLNHEHIMTASLVNLASARAAIMKCIVAEVEKWPLVPLNVTTFGSFARGDGSVTSDIDLLVIVDVDDLDTWSDQLQLASETLQTKIGNPIQFLDYPVKTWHNMMHQNDPVVTEIHRDGIHIFGEYLTIVEATFNTE
ncbi:MAG: nucleotidyltransferase domain-containing protein [Actinomycetota bacterium]|nr:nucleotidyltransferase domain-containing protein [Actinomycetota bacterium]